MQQLTLQSLLAACCLGISPQRFHFVKLFEVSISVYCRFPPLPTVNGLPVAVTLFENGAEEKERPLLVPIKLESLKQRHLVDIEWKKR